MVKYDIYLRKDLREVHVQIWEAEDEWIELLGLTAHSAYCYDADILPRQRLCELAVGNGFDVSDMHIVKPYGTVSEQ